MTRLITTYIQQQTRTHTHSHIHKGWEKKIILCDQDDRMQDHAPLYTQNTHKLIAIHKCQHIYTFTRTQCTLKPTLLPKNTAHTDTDAHNSTPSIPPEISSRYLSKHRERHKPSNQVYLETWNHPSQLHTVLKQPTSIHRGPSNQMFCWGVDEEYRLPGIQNAKTWNYT